MAPIVERLSERFRRIACDPADWPYLIVMRETIPARLRLLVAASAAVELGDDGFAEILLTGLDTSRSSLILDELRVKNPSDTYRSFLLEWLLGRGAELRLIQRLATLRMDITDREAENGASDSVVRARSTLIAVAISRWTELVGYASNAVISDERVDSLHDARSRLINIYTSPVQSFSHADLLAAFALHERSPLTTTLWSKHCGELLLLGARFSRATVAFENARAQLQKASVGEWASHIANSIERNLVALRAALFGSSTVDGELETMRRERIGEPDADFISWSRVQYRALTHAESDTKVWPNIKSARVDIVPLEEHVSDVIDLIDGIYSDSVQGRAEESDAAWWIATRLAAATGLHRALAYVSEARAYSLLHRTSPEIGDALHELILSGRPQAAEFLARFIKSGGLKSVISLVTAPMIKALAQTARSVDSVGQSRTSAFARLLEVLSNCSGWKDPVFEAITSELIRLTEEHRSSPGAAAQATRSSALKGLLALSRQYAERAGASYSGNVLGSLLAYLTADRPWTEVETSLEIASALVDWLPTDDREHLVRAVLTMLETRFPEGGGDWPVVRPALGLLCSPPLRDFFGLGTVWRARIEPLVLRFCFRAKDPEDLSAWNMGLYAVDRLGLPLPPETHALVERHLSTAEDVTVSNASVAIRDLLSTPSVITDDIGLRIIAAAEKLVRASVTSTLQIFGSQLPVAVYSIAGFWRERDQSDRIAAALLRLLDACRSLLSTAIERPWIFGLLAIPPGREAHPVVAFNWVYGVLALEHVTNRQGSTSELLAQMEGIETLAGPTARARAEFDAFGIGGRRLSESAPTIGDIGREGREQFYETLAPLLFRTLEQGEPDELLGTIGIKCLEYGPRTEDLAVLGACAARTKATEMLRRAGRGEGYVRRLQAPGLFQDNVEIRRLLEELARRLFPPKETVRSAVITRAAVAPVIEGSARISIEVLTATGRLEAAGRAAIDSILLVPSNIEGPPDAEQIFASSLPTVLKLAGQEGIPMAVYGTPSSPALLEQRSVEWFGPTMLISSLFASENPSAVSVALGMIANYLTTIFAARPDAAASLTIYVRKEKEGETKRLTYRGPVEGLRDLPKVVKDILEGKTS